MQTYLKPGDVVLDLGCGRGQDMHKFAAANVGAVIFADVSDAPLKTARDRWLEQSYAYVAAFVQLDFTKPGFLDIGGLSLWSNRSRTVERTLNARAPFASVVNFQLSLHYAATSISSLRATVQAVSMAMLPQAFLLVTAPDSGVIGALLEHPPPEDSSDLFRVTPREDVIATPATGFPYVFEMCDGFVSPEVLMRVGDLKTVCSEVCALKSSVSHCRTNLNTSLGRI
jgi:SAM-dependent methyltransferase